MDTGEVREDDSRGRHTTTHRQLIVLPDGSSVIDTPGMRELQLTGDEEGLGSAFEDVESLIAQCRFSDCGHGNESGCAVREALERGELDGDRYHSYEKLNREVAYQQRRESEKFQHEERQRMRTFTKRIKRTQKENRGRKSS
jgi:ribosome biogenesis GTPase